MIYNSTLSNYEKICSSCTVYMVLFVNAFSIIIGISSTFIYFLWYLKSDTSIAHINPGTETTIYYKYKWEIPNKLISKIVNVTFLMTWLISKSLTQNKQ